MKEVVKESMKRAAVEENSSSSYNLLTDLNIGVDGEADMIDEDCSLRVNILLLAESIASNTGVMVAEALTLYQLLKKWTARGVLG
ncbi:hypothetical protein TNCV_959241 [Trichonephila clavipes]|nr:hypothetical protein TNCV_959241 [Trichonephila clavipes]